MYALIRCLGEFEQAELWLARDRSRDATVGLVMLRPDAGEDAQWVLAEQVAAMRALDHRTIARVVHEGGGSDSSTGGIRFYALDLPDGITLAEMIASGQNAEAARVAKHVAEAVKHAHGRSVAHGSLDASKVIAGADGSVAVVGFRCEDASQLELQKDLEALEVLTSGDSVDVQSFEERTRMSTPALGDGTIVATLAAHPGGTISIERTAPVASSGARIEARYPPVRRAALPWIWALVAATLVAGALLVLRRPVPESAPGARALVLPQWPRPARDLTASLNRFSEHPASAKRATKRAAVRPRVAPKPAKADLKPASIRVVVRRAGQVVPAQLFVDGKRAGETPALIDILSGPHEFAVKTKGGVVRKKRTVAPGRNKALLIDLPEGL